MRFLVILLLCSIFIAVSDTAPERRGRNRKAKSETAGEDVVADTLPDSNTAGTVKIVAQRKISADQNSDETDDKTAKDSENQSTESNDVRDKDGENEAGGTEEHLEPPADIAVNVTVSSHADKRQTDEEVEPLDIFVGGSTSIQNFPVPMRLSTFKEQVLERSYKKMYILEETDGPRLFGQVRQLEARYFMEGDELHASFLFRFIFSRKCAEIKKFRLGKLVGKNFATFEKELKDGRTERLFFFTSHPEKYLYLMSCTDLKSSPRACHDNYYVTLGSAKDPPNQFPWWSASQELESQLELTFEDPRFIFNFVMTPCVRRS